MAITLESIKKRYNFAIQELFQGKEVVDQGKCSQWARKKELSNDKEVVYIKLKIRYNGDKKTSLLYNQFHLEDSEGYFSAASPSDDYLDVELTKGDEATGGLIFSYYRDIAPARLWFDTKVLYEDASDSILIDIQLPLPDAKTRTQVFSKEELEKTYTQTLANKTDQTPGNKTEKFIKEISHRSGIPYRKIDYGYILRVFLPEGRKQNVILNFSGKDDVDKDLITIGTICAPVHPKNDDKVFLRLNPKMAYGSIGISKIDGTDYYVITETYPADIVDRDTVVSAVKNIALKGDWLENKLTGGLDIQ